MHNLKTNTLKKKEDPVKTFFNEHAETYQCHLQKYISGWRMFINSHYVRFFGDLKGRLLDLGSGNSWYYDEDKYERVIFLDYALNMLKTRERKANSLFLNSDASYIPLQDNSVDLLLINSCLHHLARSSLKQSDNGILMCLKECKRVLKENGKILIFEGHISGRLEKLYKISFPFLYWIINLFKKPMVRPLSQESLLKFIDDVSLLIVKTEQIKPYGKTALAGCLLGNNKFLISSKFYPWKFYVYFLGK